MGIFTNRLANECFWEKQGCADEMWKEITVMIRKDAKEILGESKGIIRRDKETWWWNQRVLLGVIRRPGGGIIKSKRKLNLRNSVTRKFTCVIMREIGRSIV